MERRFATSASGETDIGDMPESQEPEAPMLVDSFRLEVEPYTHDGGGFQVLVHLNDVEMTSAGAGLGMDPYDILIPNNRLQASEKPHTTPIARCECGIYGCGATDVTITRHGDRVLWDWRIEVPMNRGVSFKASEYDREVNRAASDLSWETPERTAGRLVLTGLNNKHLLNHGLTPDGAANFYRNPELFRVALRIGNGYQVFVDTPWQGRSAEQLAAAVCATLAQPPNRWTAEWHAVESSLRSKPPAIAGSRWRPFEF